MNPAGRRLAAHEEGPAPVTIFDGAGRLIRIISTEQFRRAHAASKTIDGSRRGGKRSMPRKSTAPTQRGSRS